MSPVSARRRSFPEAGMARPNLEAGEQFAFALPALPTPV